MVDGHRVRSGQDKKKGTNMNGEGKLGSKVITWVVSGSPELSNQLQKAVKCGGGVGRI